MFTFSITPRQLLHDAIAHHTDRAPQVSEKATVGKTGFDCDRLNLVAESPFTEADEFIQDIPAQLRTDVIVASVHPTVTLSITLPALRGPPCI